MSFSELLREAWVELEDLRSIPGNTRASDAERAKYGQRTALAYLASGDIVMLEAVGPAKLGALLAGVGPAHFAVSPTGSAMLRQASTKLGKDGEAVPQVAWITLRPHLTTAGPVSDFLSACKQALPELALRTLYIAVHLIQEDPLQRHLRTTPRTTQPGIGPVVISASAQPALADPQQRALAIREAEAKALVLQVPLAEAAQALLVLAPPQRALALAAAFTTVVDSALPAEADDVREHTGRRLEDVLDEMPEDDGNATLRAMISSGDVDAVLSAVRGRAGELSSTAERLTVALIAELFESDPDIYDPDDPARREKRVITLCHTLICETRENHPAVNAFFNSPEGQALLRPLLQSSRGGDENALSILRMAERRGIAVPTSDKAKAEDEDEWRRDPDAEVEGEDFEPPPEEDEKGVEDEDSE